MKKDEKYIKRLEDLAILLHRVGHKIRKDRTRKDYTQDEHNMFHRAEYDDVLLILDELDKLHHEITAVI